MYTTPVVGTILPPQENNNPTIGNPGFTNQTDGLNQFTQASSQDTAFRRNQFAAAKFVNFDFPDWLERTYPTLAADAAPPKPPAAFVVVVNAAEQPGQVTFDVVQSGGPGSGPYIPVCEVPFYAKHPAPADPANNHIAAMQSGNTTTVPISDLFVVVSAANGMSYQRVK